MILRVELQRSFFLGQEKTVTLKRRISANLSCCQDRLLKKQQLIFYISARISKNKKEYAIRFQTKKLTQGMVEKLARVLFIFIYSFVES